TKFGTTMEPADDLLVGQRRGRVLEQFCFVLKPTVLCADSLEELFNLVRVVLRAEQARALEAEGSRSPRVFEELMPDKQRSAKRAASVAGGRLDPDVLAWAFAKKLA